MQKKYNILFFSPNLGSRQTSKIRKGFLESSNVASVFSCGFLRDVEPEPDFECKVFGRIRHRHYCERIAAYAKTFVWLFKNISKYDLTITWTVDAALFLYLIKALSRSKCAFVYNVRDVHRILTENTIWGRLMRSADKFVAQRSDLIMITSPHYRTQYYENILKIKHGRFFLLENKVPQETAKLFDRWQIRAKDFGERIVIGYFGMMSYSDRIFDIIKEISKRSFDFYLRGYNYKSESFLNGLKDYPQIEYGGGYKNPDDLAAMFAKIDITWAVDSDLFVPDTNEAWSLCNRFYEGLFFKKPLIVQDLTPASVYVKQYGLGVCIDNRKPKEMIEKISSITTDDILRWRKNVELLDESIFRLMPYEYSFAIQHAIENAASSKK